MSLHDLILPNARSTYPISYISLHFHRWCRFFNVRLLASVDLVEVSIPLSTRVPHSIIWVPSDFKCPCKIRILARARASIRILVGTRVNIRILVRILTSVRITSCLRVLPGVRIIHWIDSWATQVPAAPQPRPFGTEFGEISSFEVCESSGLSLPNQGGWFRRSAIIVVGSGIEGTSRFMVCPTRPFAQGAIKDNFQSAGLPLGDRL